MATQQYDGLMDRLQTAMMNDYVAVHQGKNPLSITLSNISTNQLAYQLGQYVLFPRYIVLFLSAAQEKAEKAGWADVASELERNIGQELGSETNHKPHYDLLVEGLNERLGIDLRSVKPSSATIQFTDNMLHAARSEEAAYALGSTYATECSAVPELRIVVRAVKELFKRKESAELGPALTVFFRKHLGDWEPSHEGLLRESLTDYLTPNQYALFEQGFRQVMSTMDYWWKGIYEESLTK